MANQGKRMVKENLIAQIGEAPEYTAGTGITISDETIAVDTDTIATKAEVVEKPLVLTQETGTLSDEDYAKLDENTVIQYKDGGITRLYYFHSDTTTQIEYRTNPIFTTSTTGSTYRFIVTKANKSYGLNYSLGTSLLPNLPGNGTFRLTNTRSGSTVTGPQWTLDYPTPDTATAGTYVLKATVDSQGAVTYSWVLES